MECEENIPEPRESLRTDLELGTVLLGREPIVDRYYRLAKDLARLYRITLCDEPEAQLIGATVWSDIFFNRGTEVNDLDSESHLHFLRSYLNLHGLSSADVSEPIRRILDWEPSGSTLRDAYDAITGEYSVSATAVVAEIQRLAGTYSVASVVQVPAVPAQPGGTIIRGSEFDFPACIPADAQLFRTEATQRRNGRWSKAASGTASGGTPGSPAGRYQVNKCSRREYSLRNDATARSHAPLADGLAPSRPPRAKAGFAAACCILEAKYVGSPQFTPYQRRRDFIRNVQRFSENAPRRLRGLSRPLIIAAWEGTRATQAAQFGAYLAAVADTEIPYWNIQYICSRDSCRNYFRDILRLARTPTFVAKSCTSSARRTTENWIV